MEKLFKIFWLISFLFVSCEKQNESGKSKRIEPIKAKKKEEPKKLVKARQTLIWDGNKTTINLSDYEDFYFNLVGSLKVNTANEKEIHIRYNAADVLSTFANWQECEYFESKLITEQVKITKDNFDDYFQIKVNGSSVLWWELNDLKNYSPTNLEDVLRIEITPKTQYADKLRYGLRNKTCPSREYLPMTPETFENGPLKYHSNYISPLEPENIQIVLVKTKFD